MNRKISLILSAILVISAAFAGLGIVGASSTDVQECEYPFSSVDATGTEVTVEGEADKVVTLSPSAAQTMWEIGAKLKVVGVSKYAKYLEGADTRTNISGSGGVNSELVVSLQPDVVLAPNVIQNSTVKKLRESGLKVYRFKKARSIEDIYGKTKLIGRLVGECEGAQKTVEEMKSKIKTVREAVSDVERPKAVYTFFGYTAGKGTFINEILQTGGVRNIATEAGLNGYKQISGETVANQNPSWIILNSDSPSVPETAAYNSTYAVKNNQIIVLNANYISQPAPRVVKPITKLVKTVHPEAYKQANMSDSSEDGSSGDGKDSSGGNDGSSGDGSDSSDGSSENSQSDSSGDGNNGDSMDSDSQNQNTGETMNTTDSKGSEASQNGSGNGLPGFGVVVTLVAVVLTGMMGYREQ